VNCRVGAEAEARDCFSYSFPPAIQPLPFPLPMLNSAAFTLHSYHLLPSVAQFPMRPAISYAAVAERG
jgi:hypothetical protein